VQRLQNRSVGRLGHVVFPSERPGGAA
jgi:hypothetical protein